jgi:hypothetical protein
VVNYWSMPGMNCTVYVGSSFHLINPYFRGYWQRLGHHVPLKEVPLDTLLGFIVVSFIVTGFVVVGCAASELSSPIDLQTKGESAC